MMAGRKMAGVWELASHTMVVELGEELATQQAEEAVGLGHKCKGSSDQGSSKEHRVDPTPSLKINRWLSKLTR